MQDRLRGLLDFLLAPVKVSYGTITKINNRTGAVLRDDQ